VTRFWITEANQGHRLCKRLGVEPVQLVADGSVTVVDPLVQPPLVELYNVGSRRCVTDGIRVPERAERPM
jgi:hypothetical protein